MRRGVQLSSAVCVLIGTNTWRSRWAKYEIARAVIDGRGLLAVHLNSINHHTRKTPDAYGINPLHFMGIYHSSNGRYYLYEKHVVVTNAAAGVGIQNGDPMWISPTPSRCRDISHASMWNGSCRFPCMPANTI